MSAALSLCGDDPNVGRRRSLGKPDTVGVPCHNDR